MEYDLIIIGAGPAGMTAAIYASRAKLKTLVLEEKIEVGGQIATTTEIENWPGQITTGPALMQTFKDHCLKFNVEIKTDQVTSLSLENDGLYKILHTEQGNTYKTKTVLIASGAEPRIIGIPGETELRGQGVSYCATCDGEFCEDLEVVSFGSGNTSLEESVFLTRFAKKVTIISRRDEKTISADKIALERAQKNPKINFIWNSTVSEIYGSKIVEGIKIKNLKTEEITDFKTDFIFMFVGILPSSKFVKGFVETTDYGYIKVNNDMETNIKGVFAAGDVIDKKLRQVITAASDGAIAAVSASKYIEDNEY